MTLFTGYTSDVAGVNRACYLFVFRFIGGCKENSTVACIGVLTQHTNKTELT
jgi:hypothetical protein